MITLSEQALARYAEEEKDMLDLTLLDLISDDPDRSRIKHCFCEMGRSREIIGLGQNTKTGQVNIHHAKTTSAVVVRMFNTSKCYKVPGCRSEKSEVCLLRTGK